MKKIAAILMAGILALSLAGCGNVAQDSINRHKSATVVLTLALRDGTYADVIEECVTKFEEENGVKCDILKLSEADLHDKIADSGENGGVDLCMVDGSWIAEFASGGYLANLYELGYELDGDIIDATTDISYYDGNLYVTPYYGNVTVLLYNKELISSTSYGEITYPSSEDLLDMCTQVKGSGKLGFMYRGDTENNVVVDFLPFLLSQGGWVVDDENRPTVDTTEFKDAVKYYKELIATGDKTSKDDLVMAIEGGNAAMAIAWPGWYTPTGGGSADYVALPGKQDASAVAYNANVYGVWTLGISAKSENQKMTEKLLEYLMDPEVQKETIDSGGVPCRYSCLQDPDILEKYPYFDQIGVALESGTYRPVMAEWNDFVTILGRHMNLMLEDEEDIDSGLSAAQTELEELLK